MPRKPNQAIELLKKLAQAQDALTEIRKNGCFDGDVLSQVTVNTRGRPTCIRIACTGRTPAKSSRIRPYRDATTFVNPSQAITPLVGYLAENRRPIDWPLTWVKIERKPRNKRCTWISVDIQLRFRR